MTAAGHVDGKAEIELEGDVGGRFEPGSDDLAIPLERVKIAEIEERARMEHRQIHGCALGHVRGVHVAAEIAGPEAAETGVADSSEAEPAEFLTTESDADHMVSALQAGADEYAMKPFTAGWRCPKGTRSAMGRQ
jgi:hypothetical protein